MKEWNPVQWVEQLGVNWEEKGERNFQLGEIKPPRKLLLNLSVGWKFRRVKEENTEMKSNGSQPQTVPGSNASSATCNLSVLNYKLLHLPGL